jgi:type IV pilus assembly protein PilV
MSAHRTEFANRSKLRGFTLVEALVALVVLAVGMLGIASLYVTTLRASGSAGSRMQAINLASDLADRIRANRRAEDAYEIAAEDAEEDATECIGTAVSCSPDQMAAYDLLIWRTAIGATLPGDATGTVNVDPGTNPATYQIQVSWRESGGVDQSYTLNMQI